MPPMPPFFNPVQFVGELFYTLIIVILCFVIHYRTKSIYELTKYKGIEYFRKAFLFFGFAYIARFLFYVLLLMNQALDMRPWRGMPHYTLVFTTFFSTIAIFYLIYSTTWKQVKEKYFIILSTLVAFFLSLFALTFRSSIIVALSQLLLILLAVILSFIGHKKQKVFSQMKVLYFLILLFWLFNLSILGPTRFMPVEVSVSLQILSLTVFFIINHKISKWMK